MGKKPLLKIDDLPELASLAQTAEVMGLTVSKVRRLIRERRLAHVEVGCRRFFVPKIAIQRFIAENTVQPCHVETQVRVSATLKSENAITSSGPNTAAAASAQLARQTAKKLKSSSRNGCNGEDADSAQVIPLRSS
jgi:excisionase family DNA binding protein